MKALKANATIAFLATVLGAFSLSAAACDLQSGGFVAATIGCIAGDNSDVGRVAHNVDRWNGANGRPFEHGVALVADAYVPGSGTALRTGWAIQNSGVLNGGGAPAPFGQQPPVAPQLGNICFTPAGRFGPGALQPVGSPCYAFLPNGPVFGTVGK